METVFLATAIAAVTELLKRANDKDYRGVVVILVAAGLGALTGVLGLDGLNVVQGIIAGLGVAGIHTIAKQVG